MKLYQEFLMGQDDLVEKEINVTGAVILKNNDEGTQSVLLIQRSKQDNWPNVWEFPRGKCDKGDKNKLEECLKREVKEEVGLDVEIIEFIDKYEYIADKGKRKSTQFNFLCRMLDSKQKIKLSFEHQDYRWIDSVGECELLIPSEMKKTISKVLNQDEKIVIYPKIKEVIGETQQRWKRKW
jgi:8-oxo-dGTP diphosphatase